MTNSKVVMYSLAAASLACAGMLTFLYGIHAPAHTPTSQIVRPLPAVALEPSAITAKAAIIYDPQTRTVLFEKNARERLPLASLTKLMSAQTILSQVHGDMEVAITQDDLKPEGDWGLLPGEWWDLNDLITFGLVASSNDAIAAAAGALGQRSVIDAMNVHAKELGLEQTSFSNPTGLDINSDEAGAYGSAYDMALLTSVFLKEHPEFFEATAAPQVAISSQGHSLEATSTTAPLLDIPGLIGAKTGYTDLAGGNLVAAFDLTIGHPIIVAVLGSTHEGRFSDVKTLVAAARAQLTPTQ